MFCCMEKMSVCWRKGGHYSGLKAIVITTEASFECADILSIHLKYFKMGTGISLIWFVSA